MKLHDLRPAPGSHKERTRVGRGIAAGKGKTAGRGTKGQKARAGGSIPPWFEGGQTPLHMRIPKLRGFKNRFKVDFEVVNIGAIAAAAERGAFEGGEMPGTASKPKKPAPVTVNQELLRAVGLVRTIKKPLKILGNGELTTALFVVADAFTKSAIAKIEAAGGTVSILEVPAEARPAIGVGEDARTPREPRTAAGRTAAGKKVEAREARAADTAEKASEAAAIVAANAAKPTKGPKAKGPSGQPDRPAGDDADAVVGTAEPTAEAPDAVDAPEAAESDASPLEAADAADALEAADATDDAETDASPLEPADATDNAEPTADDENA
jgi:large subunit ribosomal protein L15